MDFSHYMTHAATRVSGPQHNYLALVFAQQGERPVAQVVALPPIGEERNLLNAESVLREVLAGVAEANSEHGTSYAVKLTHFVSNDTGPETIYREMAKAIVGDLAQSEGQSN